MMDKRANALKDTLEQEIVSGKLEPGKRLEEMGLAERFGVSRTPVREALNKLASVGLVEIRPRRGAVVASTSIKDMIEMFEVMAEQEGLCGYLAARRMGAEEREKLSACYESCLKFAKTESYDDYYYANLSFHECIYRGAHNTYLADLTRVLRNRLEPYRRIQLRKYKRLGESSKEHSLILKAIQDGEADLARKLLKEHVAVQGDQFSDFIVTMPSSVT